MKKISILFIVLFMSVIAFASGYSPTPAPVIHPNQNGSINFDPNLCHGLPPVLAARVPADINSTGELTIIEFQGEAIHVAASDGLSFVITDINIVPDHAPAIKYTLKWTYVPGILGLHYIDVIVHDEFGGHDDREFIFDVIKNIPPVVTEATINGLR